MYAGWTQVAFGSEVRDDVVPVDIAERRLVAARSNGHMRVFDGTCPHRGAHLGHGGEVRGPTITCPFHGHPVWLGAGGTGPFHVDEYPSVLAAKGLFVLFDPAADTGLAAALRALEASHFPHEAFAVPVGVPAEYVIENVFDADHFAVVHALRRRPRLTARTCPDAVLEVQGVLEMVRPNQWLVGADTEAPAQVRFCARVFSPTVVVTELGPAGEADVVITAATPVDGGGCLVRVTVALPRRRQSGPPPQVRELASLVSGSRTAFEQDAAVWRHLDTSVVPRYTDGDALVQAYRRFCRDFERPPGGSR